MVRTLLFVAPVAALVGGGSGLLVTHFVSSKTPAEARLVLSDGKFVTLGALLVPITLDDGQLTAFASVEAQLEVAVDDVEAVEARLPLLIHAVNVRTYRTPLAGGPDGRLPDAARIRDIVSEEAAKLLGRGSVRSVAVTRIAPA